MTIAEFTTESEELSARLLGVISAYTMGVDLDARNLYQKNAPDAVPRVPADDGVTDDVDVLGHERRTVRA